MSRVRSPSARFLLSWTILFCLLLGPLPLQAQTPSIPQETREAAQRLVDAALASPVAWDRLAELVSPRSESLAILQEIGRILESIGAGAITRGGGGADIGPMMEGGMPGMGLNVEPTEYFWYHHTDADTLDKLDPEEVARCVAALAVMAYVVADLPEPLAR